VRIAASPRSCKTRRIFSACSRAALASVEFFPVGDDGRKQLPEFVSHIDLVDGLPSVGENPVEREEDVAPDHAPVTATFELYEFRRQAAKRALLRDRPQLGGYHSELRHGPHPLGR
jgi:hypothetical protein